jgi:hypothetical protein
MTARCLAERDPAFLARVGIAVQDRLGERIAEHRHRLLEGDAMFGGVARRFGRVPVEVDAHGSQLAAEGAMLERGEEGVELGEVGSVRRGQMIDHLGISCKLTLLINGR